MKEIIEAIPQAVREIIKGLLAKDDLKQGDMIIITISDGQCEIAHDKSNRKP